MTDLIRDRVEGRLSSSDVEMVEPLRELVLDDGLRLRMSEHNRTVPSTMTWANAMLAHDATYSQVRSSSPLLVARRPLSALEG
jgi:hypothetical protein